MPQRYLKVFIRILILSVSAATMVSSNPVLTKGPKPMQRMYRVAVVESVGLKTVVFTTPAGTLRVNLPDDASAGDTISGTVYLAPAGKTRKERRRNTAELNGYVVDVAGNRSASTNRVVTFDLPPLLKGNSFSVSLRNSRGKTLSKFDVPAGIDLNQPGTGVFQIPEIGQAGGWINVSGPFDGDLSNTGLEIGGVSASPLAESPRKTVFQSPANVIGSTEIRLSEGNTRIVQEFRNIGVNLGAGKLHLQRGETTSVTVTVEGLRGIEDDVPLNLTCTGSADMQDGNVQNIQITPQEVGQAGTFSFSKRLIGNQVGTFNVKATVLTEQKITSVSDQPVHIEKDPVNISDDENDKVWWLKIKTLDGKTKDIYIKQDFKPNLKFCEWIKIDKFRTEESTGWIYVTNYQKVDDPKAPCELKDQTVKVEGNPVGPINGKWQIRVTTPDGKTIYIYVSSPGKPNIRKGQWIRIKDCKKLNSNSFGVDGYDVVDDPKKPPPAPIKPIPAPTPTPVVRPPAPVVRPCTEGDTRHRREVKKVFEIMTDESEVIFRIYPDKDSGSAADNMAAWLNGTKKLRDFVGDNLPQGVGAGGAAAGAVLTYVDLGADIITALGKSRLRNLAVSEVTAELFITTKKVTAVCTTYEVCVGGRWVRKREYSETVADSTYRRTKSIFKGATGWEKVSVTSRPQSFDPDKAEAWGKEYLKNELKKLKKNGDDYKAFKEKCK